MNPSSTSAPERRFFFDAAATGIRGRLVRPRMEKLNANLTLALSASGGDENSSEKNIEVEGVLKVGSFTTSVDGRANEAARTWETKVVARVEKLEILNRLRVELIESCITSSVPYDGGERTFSIEGSRIEGLVIDGEAIETGFDARPFHRTTWPALRDSLAKDEKSKKRLAEKDPAAPARLQGDTPRNGSLLSSLTDIKPPRKADLKVLPGGCIVIPDFGRIWLAELLTSPDRWQLTMLRAKLGSPAEGTFDVGETTANGQRYPP